MKSPATTARPTRTSRRSSNLALAAMMALGAGQSVYADIFDTNSTTGGFGVTNGSSYDWWTANYWSDGALAANDAGTAGTVTWQGTSGVSEQAFFVGSGVAGENYTVRLGGTGATDTYIQNLALNVNAAGSAALSGAAGNVTIGNLLDTGKLILRAANSVGAQNSGTLTVNNGINLNAVTMNFRGGNVVINGAISGTGTSNISSGGSMGLSSGTLTLAGNNSFAGNTTVASGYVFSLQRANALGGTGGTNSVSSGGTMEVAGGVTIVSGESVSITGDGVSSIGALRAGTGGGTWSGGVTLAATAARLGATTGNTLTVTGTISGAAGFGFNVSGQGGTGVVVINPTTSNTYTGTSGIVRGILRLGKTDALPTGTTLDVDSISSVTDAATFDMASFSQTVAVLQDSAGGAGSTNGKITNSVASTISTLTVNQASNTAFDGVIENGSGSVVLTKGGAGNLTLTGANTYTGGTNIQNGKIIIGNGNDRLATGGSVVLGAASTSGVLVLGDGTARNQTLVGLTTTGNGGAVVGGAAANSTLTLNIASGTNTFSGTLGGGGTNENNLALSKSGNGTLGLSTAHTYSGGTTISAGTLQLSGSGTTGSGGVTLSGGIFDMGGLTRTVGAVSLTGAGTIQNGTLLGSSYAASNTSGTATVSANLTGSGITMSKSGAGTLVLSGASNSYTGLTTVTAGVLASSNNTNAFGDATGGAALQLNGGTLRIANNSTNNIAAYNTTVGGNAAIQSDKATSSSGVTHTLGTLSIGANTLTVTAGANVQANSPYGLTFGATTLTGNAALSISNNGSGTGTLTVGAISGSTNNLTKSGSGTLVLSGASNVFGDLNISAGNVNLTNNASAAQGTSFASTISGSGTLNKSGTGTLTLSGANSTFTGALNVTAGTLKVTNSNSLGTGTKNVTVTGSTWMELDGSGGDISFANTITFRTSGNSVYGINNLAGNNTINGGLGMTSGAGNSLATVTGGSLTLAGTVQAIVAGGRSLTLNGTTTGNEVSGQIIDGTSTVSIIKDGAGTWTLSNANNTYTGNTTVAAGVLAVDGSLGATAVTVTGGTLQGNGSISGSVTVQTGGTLASGNSIDSLATGTLSMDAGSTFAYEINNDAAAGAAGDLTAVTGGLNIALTNNALITFTELGAGSWTDGEKLTLISYTGAWNGGLFDYGGDLLDDSVFNYSGIDWRFNYNDTSAGNNYTGELTGSTFVTMTAVPEPTTTAFGLLAAAGLLLHRRRA